MAESLTPETKDIYAISNESGVQISIELGEGLLKWTESYPGFRQLIDELLVTPVVDMNEERDVVTININLAAIGERPQENLRVCDLNSVNDLFGYFNNYPYIDTEKDDDTKIIIELGSHSMATRDGRLAMDAVVRWPEADNQEIEEMTTLFMRRAAIDLGYVREVTDEPDCKDLVYARVNRDYGVVLQTNPLGSCSIATDGMEFNSDEAVFELHAHNIYSVDQQLICLVGAATIAHAGDLL